MPRYTNNYVVLEDSTDDKDREYFTPLYPYDHEIHEYFTDDANEKYVTESSHPSSFDSASSSNEDSEDEKLSFTMRILSSAIREIGWMRDFPEGYILGQFFPHEQPSTAPNLLPSHCNVNISDTEPILACQLNGFSDQEIIAHAANYYSTGE